MIAKATYNFFNRASGWLLSVLIVLVFSSCANKKTAGPNGLHFKQLSAGKTHIDFNNQITESDSINVYKNEYMYNGSGVATADFNNDGLLDVFFCGSMVTSRLYINKGNMTFADVTESAGLTTAQWCTGVSVADVNADGYLDLYVSSSHSSQAAQRTNMLFINDGKLHFSNQAEAYGLADTGYSTQSAFVDYDKDGDLDLYLLNHRLYDRNPNNLVQKDTSGHSPAQDRLYRNQGTVSGSAHPVFTDVTMVSGIKEDGYGLGVIVTDVNNDNWPDIYVANDYIGNDLLWLNNQDGTFTNTVANAMRHQSFNSMGVDAADINNDGLADIAVLDMAPETNERKKMMFMASGQEKYDMERRLGYEPAFVRNVLQLNNGVRTNNNKSEPFYSEIGQLAGIAETDWSWSILMADFDNDGWKDMHITNGLAKDVTNNDYVAFKNSQNQHSYDFTANKNAGAMDEKTIRLLRQNLDQYGAVEVSNYLYANNGDLTFTNATNMAGLGIPSVSNGAAYADLDNDGDLDLVVNNMNQQAFIWQNETTTKNDSLHHFITIQLEGNKTNSKGYGAKVWCYTDSTLQYAEQSPVRGFSSSVDDRLHFGFGKQQQIDSIKILWPDNSVQILADVKVDQQLILQWKNASLKNDFHQEHSMPFFTNVSAGSSPQFVHKESQYFDFGSQRLVPQRFSQLGPCIATGDVNGDGLEDFFIGGAARQSGVIYIQQPGGDFASHPLVQGMKDGEDLAAVFFDSDGDNDSDLIVVGGSQEYGANSPLNQPRLFTNDGAGSFTLQSNVLPAGIHDISTVVNALDYDADGDIDLFIGGRMVPEKYPQSPRSYLLQNTGGRFIDVTKKVCPALEYAGLLTGAVVTDFDNDQIPDLVVCGEWMPVRFFKGDRVGFAEVTDQTGFKNKTGQWRSLLSADLDADGDVDLVAGNMGWNNRYHLSDERPFYLYAADFDDNNTIDIIPAYHIKDNKEQYQLFPSPDRSQLADAIPSVKKKFLLNSTYSTLSMKALLSSFSSRQVTEKICETTSTVWLENKGHGKFVSHALPVQAQFAPVNTMLARDVTGDGQIDLLLAGNEYQADVVTGRYDASYGVLLTGDGKGNFTHQPNTKTGFTIDGDVKSLKMISQGKKLLLLAAVNDGSLLAFTQNKKPAL